MTRLHAAPVLQSSSSCIRVILAGARCRRTRGIAGRWRRGRDRCVTRSNSDTEQHVDLYCRRRWHV